MARGPKKHLKRLATPKHWMLSKKMGGIYAPRPRAGPHKLRESLPLLLLIRNRLKYALSAKEAYAIIKARSVKVDGRVRTDAKFPAGFMDVLSIPATQGKYRLLLDVKGRTVLVKIPAAEENRKLLRVTRLAYGANRIPYAVCHDGRVVRYPDPHLSKNDTIVFNLQTGKPESFLRFKPGKLAMVTGGANTGRVGKIIDVERHLGSFDVVHLEDAAGSKFATRLGNVFVIGESPKEGALVTLPRQHGVREDLMADRTKRIENYAQGKERARVRA